METTRCIVKSITYANEENGWTVLKGQVRGFSEPMAFVGSMGAVHVGSVLSVTGEWANDAKYGRQFRVSKYEELLPATVHGIEKYLGSGLIVGVGPKFAARIVKTFGAGTLDIIDNEPDRLIEVPGIGQKRVDKIKEAWNEQREVKNIMLFLQEHDVGAANAYRIYKELGAESISIVKENPYRLTDIWGIGFKTADTIARKMGFDAQSAYRCKSGLIYTLNESSNNNGHCFLPRKDLTRKGSEILGIEEGRLDAVIDEMLLVHDLILEPPDSIYMPPFFFSEYGVARRLKTLLAGEPRIANAGVKMEDIETATGIKYDDAQKEAILTAANSKAMILTGGPGTGKTTTVKGIIALFRAAGAKMLLAAPTGRAAKRLSETTGMEAKTIHRLLEARPPGAYQKNEDNRLVGDVLVVDESSMIDIILMYNLLKAIPDEMAVIFVGDVDQLPSVGPGNVLRDMIDSGAVPVVKLTRIFRQAMDSQIIRNAHLINRGGFPDLRNTGKGDFFFVNQEDNDKIPETIVNLCSDRLPKFFGVKPAEIQVLCPMNRGSSGAYSLNDLLQGVLNRSRLSLQRGGVEYRYGDKVMQKKNNYDKEVFNGDIGIIVGIDREMQTLEVSFDDGNPIPYTIRELDELGLAYATTVHKAQGSEYDVVLLPVTTQHYMMLQRNLLYTGITRAKKAVVIVGTKKAIAIAVKNDRVTRRNTNLAMRLAAL